MYNQIDAFMRDKLSNLSTVLEQSSRIRDLKFGKICWIKEDMHEL